MSRSPASARAFALLALALLTGCSGGPAPAPDVPSDTAALDDGPADTTLPDAPVADTPDATLPDAPVADTPDATLPDTPDATLPDARPDRIALPDAPRDTMAPVDAAADVPAAPRCGDGVPDRTFDPATRWFREECDEGARNGRGACGTDCRFRPCGTGRLCPPVRSTFVYGFGGDHARIAGYFLQLKEQGYNEVILLGVGVQRYAYSGGTFRVTSETDDALDTATRMVEVAAPAGMGVIVGLMSISVETAGHYDWEIWPVPTRRADAVRFGLDLASRIDARVGTSPAFRGYYITQEFDVVGLRASRSAGWDPLGYFAALIQGEGGRRGLRALAGSSRLVTIAPYLHALERDDSGAITRVHPPAEVGADAAYILEVLGPAGGVDRVMVQDGVPKGWTRVTNCDGAGQPPCLAQYFRAMESAYGARANRLWVDLETYDWPQDPRCNGLDTPETIDRLALQVRAVGASVGGFTQWIHRYTFMASVGDATCDARREALGQAYQRAPLPISLFALDVSGRRALYLRGYHLEQAGQVRVTCPTTGGGSGTFAIRLETSDPRFYYYNPTYRTAAGEVVELAFWRPTECAAGATLDVVFENPGGATSVPWRGGW
jgi:hypothetical protein